MKKYNLKSMLMLFVLVFLTNALSAQLTINESGAWLNGTQIGSWVAQTSLFATPPSDWNSNVTLGYDAANGFVPTAPSPNVVHTYNSLNITGTDSCWFSIHGMWYNENSWPITGPLAFGTYFQWNIDEISTVYFRLEFEVPNSYTLSSGYTDLALEGNTYMKAYINGALVHSSSLSASISSSQLYSNIHNGRNVIAVSVDKEDSTCPYFLVDSAASLYSDTINCSNTTLKCASVGCGSTLALAQYLNGMNLGQLYGGTYGAAGGDIWSGIGSNASGVAPYGSNTYGLAVENQGYKAFYGTRPSTKDGVDALVAWGATAGSRLIFEYHGAQKDSCNSTPFEVATMLANGNVGIGLSYPQANLDINNQVQYAAVNAITTSYINAFNYGGVFEADNASVTNVGLLGIANMSNPSPPSGTQSFGGWFIAGNGLLGGFGGNGPSDANVGIYASNNAYNLGTGDDPNTDNGGNGIYPGYPSYDCAGIFDGDVLTTGGSYMFSDEKLKTNIKDFKGSLDLIRKLNTKTYDFKTKEYRNSVNLPHENQIGIMAQNVQAVFPNLVKEKFTPGHINPKTNKKMSQDTKALAVNYVGLIPVLVASVNEMATKTDSITILKSALDNTTAALANTNTTIAALQKQIDDICNGGCASLQGLNGSNVSGAGNSLLQNVPNPFSAQTTIGYVLNVGTTAYLNVNGLDGKLIKHMVLAISGPGSVNISANELTAGTYTYSLFVDGKAVDTKLMVITAGE